MSEGSTGLAVALTAAAMLGGLLFGYDTAVISGVTSAITRNFVAPRHRSETRCCTTSRACSRTGAPPLTQRTGSRPPSLA